MFLHSYYNCEPVLNLRNEDYVEAGMVTHTFSFSNWEAGASQVCMVSSRPTIATQWDGVSERDRESSTSVADLLLGLL